MNESMTKLMELAKDRSREIVTNGDTLTPVLLIKESEGVSIVGIVMNQFLKDIAKDAFTTILRRAGATGYVFVAEAWATKSMRPLTEGISVSELPLDDRSEVVEVLAVEKGGDVKVAEAKVTYTKGHRSLGEFEELVYSSISGKFMVRDW